MSDPVQQTPTAEILAGQTDPRGDNEINHLKQRLQSSDFSRMRAYLARTRDAHDWQDRCYILNRMAQDLPREPLTAACAAEPEAADLRLLLGLHFYGQLGRSRGSDTADKTSQEQIEQAGQHLHEMMTTLLSVYPLAPEDPTPHVFAVRGLVVFSTYESTLKREYAEAVRLAPDCVPAHYAMVNARSKKWGGSQEEALHIARAAQGAGNAGSDLPACLFLAHFLAYQYAQAFEGDKAEAARYLKDPRVTQELTEALDRWIGGAYRPRRSSLPYLHQAALWYYLSGDDARLGRLLTLTGDVLEESVWGQFRDPQAVFSKALQRAGLRPAPPPAPKKPGGILGWFKR